MVLACRTILGIQDWPADGGVVEEGGSDAASNYNSLSDTSKWATFDLSVLASTAQGYAGGVFDGRYIYFAPSYSSKAGHDIGLILQYDTQGPGLAPAQSWNMFDLTTKDGKAAGYTGATFDGRYVYFIPSGGPVAARFDTQGTFGDANAWATFDMSTVNAAAGHDFGAAFDGKYMYFAPTEGIAMRYDTTASFVDPASWLPFDMSNLEANTNYNGALFVGTHLYFAPWRGRLAQYDITRTFTTPTSWQTFDTSTVDLRAGGFSGASFDGRYAYFVPQNNGSDAGFGFDGVVTRYDTQVGFTAASSYSVFDMAQLNSQAIAYSGAAFDGKYMYFVPNDVVGALILTRFDTTQDFTAPASWETLPLAQILSTVKYMSGAVFDGQYVYFIPNTNGKLLRFQATNTPVTPVNNGSFF